MAFCLAVAPRQREGCANGIYVGLQSLSFRLLLMCEHSGLPCCGRDDAKYLFGHRTVNRHSAEGDALGFSVVEKPR